MLAFPNAKINLGLRILRKRPDGYHDIDSCLYPVPWRDVLEIMPADQFTFRQTGLPIPAEEADNLCVRAYRLIAEKKSIQPVQIHLHKTIPMGAGLGGGSADGATTLKVLNAIFQLDMDESELTDMAARLGSDCPFFIGNRPALASGTGTTLTPIDITLSGGWIALYHPGIHIPTADAYRHITAGQPDVPVSEIVTTPVDQWKGRLINDFEAGAVRQHPLIGQAIDHLYATGAHYAAMSGSGSAVYGLFDKQPDLPDYQVYKLP